MNTIDNMWSPISFLFNKPEMRKFDWIDTQNGQLETPCQKSNRQFLPTKGWGNVSYISVSGRETLLADRL